MTLSTETINFLHLMNLDSEREKEIISAFERGERLEITIDETGMLSYAIVNY